MHLLCIKGGFMKRKRQQEILSIISRKRIATQQELAEALAKRGVEATQSSVSRDIIDMGLTKLDGRYVGPERALKYSGPVEMIDTAGDNIIVIKTQVGLAQPTALTIDGAEIDEIVGTLAGDDTILVAVKNQSAQRVAMKKIAQLFVTSSPATRTRKSTRARRSTALRFF